MGFYQTLTFYICLLTLYGVFSLHILFITGSDSSWCVYCKVHSNIAIVSFFFKYLFNLKCLHIPYLWHHQYLSKFKSVLFYIEQLVYFFWIQVPLELCECLIQFEEKPVASVNMIKWSIYLVTSGQLIWVHIHVFLCFTPLWLSILVFMFFWIGRSLINYSS